MKAAANLAIAIAVGGGLFAALIFLETSTPGLDLGAVKFVMPMVLGSGLFAGLNARAGNRRMSVANDARKAELLAFPPRPGHGWVVVMRDKGKIGSGIGFDVAVDQLVVAQLMPKHFTMLALPAGSGNFAGTPLDLAVAPGATQIFAIRSSMGLMRTAVRLDPVADTPATRSALARMQLVEAQG
jgi:hypothetical protein